MKQRLSVEKLKQRNINFVNSQLMGDSMNLSNALSHQQRFQLPLLFLEIPETAHIKASQDDSKLFLKLQCDEMFTVRDENALLHVMGLPETTEEDIKRVFDPEIAHFLKT